MKYTKNLNCSINYQSVDHELLGYFYESTLLQLSEKKAENIRREFGIYYTPRILSQEIVSCIPFEVFLLTKGMYWMELVGLEVCF